MQDLKNLISNGACLKGRVGRGFKSHSRLKTMENLISKIKEIRKEILRLEDWV